MALLDFVPQIVKTFVGLTDTPAAYTNQSGKVPTVNTTETALEFGYPHVDGASKLGFNPHIWAGPSGYQKSASNPILDDNDFATIAGVSLATIQAGNGGGNCVVKYHNGRYYMFFEIDVGAGTTTDRSIYLISSTTPDFAEYTNHGQVIATATSTFYSSIIYPTGLIYDPFATGSGTNLNWKMLIGSYGSGVAGFTWAYASDITGPWTVYGAGSSTNPFDTGTGFGGGAELIGNIIYYIRIDSGAAPYTIRAYQMSARDYTAGASFTANATTDVITSTAHGLSNGDRISFTTTNTLPAGLSLNTIYYVRDKTTDTFKVATTFNGTAIDITSTGTGTHYWSKRIPIGDITPTLTGDYAYGFRFFSVFKHFDGLYLVSYNENSGGLGVANYGNLYLLVADKFGQSQLTVQSCSPICKHGTTVGDWDYNRILSPSILLNEYDVYLYFSGINSSNKAKIGLATLSGSW